MLAAQHRNHVSVISYRCSGMEGLCKTRIRDHERTSYCHGMLMVTVSVLPTCLKALESWALSQGHCAQLRDNKPCGAHLDAHGVEVEDLRLLDVVRQR